jgi:acetyl esterase/lipase
VSGTQRRSREAWIIAIGVGSLLAAGVGVALQTDLFSLRTPDPTEEELIPRDWGDDIAPDELDVAYGPETGCSEGQPDNDCGGSQELDIYLAREGGDRDTIVYFHGGGFVTGDKSELTGLGNIKRQLARGFGLVAVNYRLTDVEQGENGFPDAMTDVAAAVDWVRANGSDHGLNTDVIVAAGGSAGGTLAALAGTTANSPEPIFAELEPVDGWMSISGVMTWKGGESSQGWMQAWLGPDYLEQRDIASATSHLDFDDPPGYLAHGADDTFVETDNAGHQPIGGANRAVMDGWLDEIVQQGSGSE